MKFAELLYLEQWVRALEQREPRVEPVTLILGDGRGNVQVGDNPFIQYARLFIDDEKIVRCFNAMTGPIEGLYVEGKPFQHPTYQTAYWVTGISPRAQQSGAEQFILPKHAPSHEWPGQGVFGNDVMNVYPRMLTPGRVSPTRPASLAVQIAPIDYWWTDGFRHFAQTTTPSLTLPAMGNWYALVYFSPGVNEYGIRYGAAALQPKEPTPAGGEYPLASVYLRPGMTTIIDEDITDRRDPFSLFMLMWGQGGGDVVDDDEDGGTVIVNAPDADITHNPLMMSLASML